MRTRESSCRIGRFLDVYREDTQDFSPLDPYYYQSFDLHGVFHREL